MSVAGAAFNSLVHVPKSRLSSNSMSALSALAKQYKRLGINPQDASYITTPLAPPLPVCVHDLVTVTMWIQPNDPESRDLASAFADAMKHTTSKFILKHIPDKPTVFPSLPMTLSDSILPAPQSSSSPGVSTDTESIQERFDPLLAKPQNATENDKIASVSPNQQQQQQQFKIVFECSYSESNHHHHTSQTQAPTSEETLSFEYTGRRGPNRRPLLRELLSAYGFVATVLVPKWVLRRNPQVQDAVEIVLQHFKEPIAAAAKNEQSWTSEERGVQTFVPKSRVICQGLQVMELAWPSIDRKNRQFGTTSISSSSSSSFETAANNMTSLLWDCVFYCCNEWRTKTELLLNTAPFEAEWQQEMMSWDQRLLESHR